MRKIRSAFLALASLVGLFALTGCSLPDNYWSDVFASLVTCTINSIIEAATGGALTIGC